MLWRSLGAVSLLVVVPLWPLLPWPLPPALSPQADYPVMRYPSKSLASLTPRPGTAATRQRAGKGVVVFSSSLRSDAHGAASGSGTQHLNRALPKQLQHELWEREELANLGCDHNRASEQDEIK